MNVTDRSRNLRSSRTARVVRATSIMFCGAVAGAIVLASCSLFTLLILLWIVDLLGVVLSEDIVDYSLMGILVVSVVSGMMWGAFRVGKKFPVAETSRGKAESIVCANCGFVRQGRWCSKCGQNDRDYRRLFRLLSEVVGEMFEADSRVWRTLRNLLLQPGFLSLEFAQNRRAHYLSPFRLYLFASLLYFLLISFLGGPSNSSVDEANVADTDLTVESPTDSFGISNQFYEFLPLSILLAIPLYALLLQFVAIGRRTYCDHFVFVLHFQTVGFLVLIPLIPWMVRVFDVWQYVAYFLPLSVYLLFALKRFHGTNWLNTIGTCIAAISLYIVLFCTVLIGTDMALTLDSWFNFTIEFVEESSYQ